MGRLNIFVMASVLRWNLCCRFLYFDWNDGRNGWLGGRAVQEKSIFNLERSWVLASDTKICIFSNYVCCTSKDSVYL